MQITVFGASGKVGQLVVGEALRRGYQVVAFVHSHDPFEMQERLRVYKGDIYNSADVAEALKGSQAVISTLGSWGTPRRDVLTAAMRAVIPAMEQGGIRRIITLTGSGAAAPYEKVGVTHRLLMALLRPFPAGKVFRDGEEHMQLLAASGLDWTTVRSPVMTRRQSTRYKLIAKGGNPFAVIPRQSVAVSIVDQIEGIVRFRQAPVVCS